LVLQVDQLPATIKSGIPKAEAEELQKKFAAGVFPDFFAALALWRSTVVYAS
jgi:hypothetical protein